MSKSVLHAVSTRVTNISQRAGGPRSDIGQGFDTACDTDLAIYYSLQGSHASGKTGKTLEFY